MINAITSGSGAPAATQSQSQAAFSGLDKDAFLKLLVAQLRYQNPLSPMDGQEYLAQAAQFATVEKLEALEKSNAETVAYQQVMLSASLVGKHVRGTPELSTTPVEGVVQRIKFEGGSPLLVVDGVDVPLGSIERLDA